MQCFKPNFEVLGGNPDFSLFYGMVPNFVVPMVSTPPALFLCVSARLWSFCERERTLWIS